jgi:hypothetical protein
MNRRLRVLSLALGLALVGCVKSTESTQPRSSDESGTPSQATPPAKPAPAPAKSAPAPSAPAPSEAPPSEPSSDSSGAGSGTGSDEGSGGGRMAKPGWCKEDSDCPGGQVCEACEGEKCCVVGCHSDNQCGAGQKCRQVQCIRAPCPGMCE